MLTWWNWQTRGLEEAVFLVKVRVQIPPSAQRRTTQGNWAEACTRSPSSGPNITPAGCSVGLEAFGANARGGRLVLGTSAGGFDAHGPDYWCIGSL